MSTIQVRPLGRGGPPTTRLGLGLAALGRPAYHTLGHAEDLAGHTSRDALERHTHGVLDAAWAAGVRAFDVARSYGAGEDMLSAWLRARGVPPGEVLVGSKWGYVYVGDWRLQADRHEVKDHGLATFQAQQERTLGLLGPWLGTYSIHSATEASGVLDDDALLDALAAWRAAHGVRLGLTLSGPGQATTLRRALALRGGGFFDVVQATFNVLEPSVGPALREAHAAGLGVVVKEALANGRLTARGAREGVLAAQALRLHTSPDALALAWVLDHPWADLVLSGASTVAQLGSNLQAAGIALDEEARLALAHLAEPPEAYWGRRADLPWT